MKLSQFNIIKTYKKNKRYRHTVKCECGCEYNSSTQTLLRRKTNKCMSCIMKNKSNRKFHGMSNTRIYRVWEDIKKRCYSKNNKSYIHYGGRGIIVCDEWLNSFVSFYEWAMQNGYTDKLTIDRIDNDKNYEPSNCRFSNKNTQSRNTRVLMSTNTSGYRGVNLRNDNKKYRAVICIDNKSICILNSYDKLECAKAYDQYIIDNNLEHTKNFS